MAMSRFLALVFAATCLATLAGLIAVGVRGIPVVTDLSVVLPQSRDSQVEVRIQKRLNASFGRKTVIAIFSDDATLLDAAADLALEAIGHSNLIALDPPQSGAMESAIDFLVAHRFGLLDPGDAAAITGGDYTALEGEVTRYLHGFPASVRWLPFAEDPYNLFGRFLASAIPMPDLSVYDDYLVAHRPSGDVVLVTVKPVAGGLAIDSQPAVLAAFAEINSSLAALPGVRVVMSGAFFHIAEATQKSKREVVVISTASIALIALIFFVTFRAFAPLLFAMASIAFGFLAAAAVTGNLFGEIHLLTLVFGTSLIGLSIDYAFHFLCMGEASNLGHLRKSSLIALVSTALAYGLLTGSAIAVVDQIATFAVTGLAACWLFVVVVYQHLLRRSASGNVVTLRSAAIERIGHRMQHLWDRGNRVLFLLVLAVIIPLAAIAVVSTGRMTESLASLYVPNQALLANDRQVAEAFGQYSPNQFFAIEGESIQQVLARMEVLSPILSRWKQEGAVAGYQLLSDLVPSLSTQSRHYDLVKRAYGEAGQLYTAVDLAPTAANALRQAVRDGDGHLIGDDLFAELVSTSLPHLFLGEVDHAVVAIVPLQGVNDLAALSAASLPEGVRFVNLVDSWAESLRLELLQSAQILQGTIILIALGLVLWFRRAAAMLIAIVPASAALIVVGGLSLVGHEISLFHLFGLYLVIGLGLDYGIFIFRNEGDDPRCFVAVFLSAVTTIFAFGLLSQSSTPMISAFGTTIFFGTVLNIMLAPGIRLFLTHADSKKSLS